MIDIPYNEIMIVPLKKESIQVHLIERQPTIWDCYETIPEGKACILNIVCENGHFMILVDEEESLRLD